MDHGSTPQLDFSVGKLMKLASGCMLLCMGAGLIPFDRSIASGHSAGPWNAFLYEIGPTGRWSFALACAGLFLFGAFCMAMVAASARVALRVGEDGIFVRTIVRKQEVPWRDILVIDTRSTTYRRRTRRSVRVRFRTGDDQKSLLVPLNLLKADEDDVANWIAHARRIHADKISAKAPGAPPSSSGFGRKRTFVAPEARSPDAAARLPDLAPSRHRS